MFEYGVNLNGSKTSLALRFSVLMFEYGVNLNGSKTYRLSYSSLQSLSMVKWEKKTTQKEWFFYI